MAATDLDAALDDEVGDDLLRLIFTACHPVLSTEARVALTLRLLGGLTTDEIARAFLVSEATVAQRIVRAKRTLGRGGRRLRGAVGRRARRARLASVLEVDLPDLQRGLRRDRRRRLDAAGPVPGRAAAGPHPGGAGAGRARGPRARGADGDSGVADPGADRAGRRAGAAARPGPGAVGPAAHRGAGSPRCSARGAVPRPGGPYVVQAAIAACHARARAGGHRLGADRRALRSARPGRAVARRRAQPRRGRGARVRAGGGAGSSRRPGRRGGAEGLSPAPKRAWRPAVSPGPLRRGARRVQLRGVVDAQRARARAAARPRRGLRLG